MDTPDADAASASAPTGVLSPDPAQDGAPLDVAPTTPPKRAARASSRKSRDTYDDIPNNDDPGCAPTGNVSDSTSRTSRSSGGRSDGSRKSWVKPTTVKEFAAQVNEIATMVMNDKIGLDKARAYGNLARTLAQLVSAEVTRARFIGHEPDLSLDGGGDDGA